jgi:hypothetical protein
LSHSIKIAREFWNRPARRRFRALCSAYARGLEIVSISYACLYIVALMAHPAMECGDGVLPHQLNIVARLTAMKANLLRAATDLAAVARGTGVADRRYLVPTVI